MIVWPPYPWYFDLPTHGILSPYTWYVDPPTMVCWPPLYMVYCTPYPLYLTSYPWYFNPPTHGILNPLPMVFWPPIHGILTPPSTHCILTPYPWYFDPPTHGISRGSIYHEGFKIQWWNIDPGVNISWKLTPGSKYHMTPVLQPKTSKTLFRPVHFLVI
jgi:hypothetical protein